MMLVRLMEGWQLPQGRLDLRFKSQHRADYASQITCLIRYDQQEN